MWRGKVNVMTGTVKNGSQIAVILSGRGTEAK